jgi:hypothetical protein
MPAHPALGISEILALIFEELQDDKKSLAICARTCKLFSEPALNMLWRRLSISEMMVQVSNIYSHPSTLEPKDSFKLLVSGSLSKFNYYAKRVQIIRGSSDAVDKYIRLVYHRLAEAVPGRDLFPLAHTLGVSGENRFSLSMQLPQSLRTLEVHFEQGENESYNAGLYILSAVSQTPLLEHLILAGTVYHPMILVHIASFNHLRSLDLLNITLMPSPKGLPIIQDGLRKLLGMKSLLKLILPLALDAGDLTAGIISCNLRTIDISGNPSFFCAAVTSFLSKTPMHSITIRAQNTSSNDVQASARQWGNCLDQLRVHCGASLRCIIFHPSALDYGSHSFKALQPLLQLHHLEEFHASSPLVLSVDDIAAMATAWPNIQCLRLDVTIHPPANELPTSTFHSLVPVARFCPKLRTLRMMFSDTDLPSTADFPCLSHPLQEIHLVVQSVRDYVKLAALLDRIFPSLDKVFIDGWHHDEEIRNWVPRMIHVLQSVRKERRFAESESG